MRKPDQEAEIKWRGQRVLVRTWVDDTEEEWDGDEPLEPGSKGYDVMIEVLLVDVPSVKIGDSLCNIWVTPDPASLYLQDQIVEVTETALEMLFLEIEEIAEGREVRQAKARQKKLTEVWRTCTVAEILES